MEPGGCLWSVSKCVTPLNRLVLRHPPSLRSRSSHLPSRHCRRLRPDGSDSGSGGSSERNGSSGGLRGGLCSSPNPADDPKCLLLHSVYSLLRRRRGLERFCLHFRLGLASSDVMGPTGSWEVALFRVRLAGAILEVGAQYKPGASHVLWKGGMAPFVWARVEAILVWGRSLPVGGKWLSSLPWASLPFPGGFKFRKSRKETPRIHQVVDI